MTANTYGGRTAAPAPRGTRSETSSAPLARDFDLEGQTLLLALDGSPGAIAGAHIAMALARKHRAFVNVLQVVDTRAVPFPPAIAMLDLQEFGSHVKQENEARATLSAALGELVDWPVRVVLGTPSEEIVRQAQSLGAALIIVGLRRHGPIDRALNNETALRVMRHALCPVLGVVPGTTELPVRVLAAIDFSCVSMAAARAASELVGEKGALVLAYVPQLDALLADEGEKVVHELGMHEAFKRAARELEARRVPCDHIVLHQEAQDTPAELLLEYADASRSDLIAAGSARHSRIQRWMIGSVSTELVRDGRRSVLIIPSRCAPRR